MQGRAGAWHVVSFHPSSHIPHSSAVAHLILSSYSACQRSGAVQFKPFRDIFSGLNKTCVNPNESGRGAVPNGQRRKKSPRIWTSTSREQQISLGRRHERVKGQCNGDRMTTKKQTTANWDELGQDGC